MNDAQDSVPPDRFWPPESRATGGVRRTVRWVMQLGVVVVVLVLFFVLYAWFIGNGTRHEQPLTGPVTETDSNSPADSTQITAAQALAGAELASSTASPTAPLTAVANLGNINDPDQRRSVCGFLTAEFGRLNYEFHQPLPPPVVDRVATEVAQLREQVSRFSCASSDVNTPTDTPPSGSNTPATSAHSDVPPSPEAPSSEPAGN